MTLMQRALAQIATRLEVARVEGLVRRADLDKRDRLVVEVEVGVEDDTPGRWFRIDGDNLKELRLEAERKLPLAEWFASDDGRGEVISWRPGRRIVIAVETPRGAEIWKGHRPKRLADAARRHALAHSLCGDAGDAFLVPDLLGVDCEKSALRLARTVGFEPRIGTGDAADFDQLGRALRALQDGGERVGEPLAEQLGTHTSADELAVLVERGRRCDVALGGPPAGFERVLKQLERAVPDAVAPVPCHRDLHDRQILLGGGRPTVLDLDLLCLADPLLDVANLLAHLALRRLQGVSGATPEGVRACGDALLDGLDREDLDDYLPRLRFHQGTALLRLAALYAVRPRWTALAADLVRLAERCARETLPTRS